MRITERDLPLRGGEASAQRRSDPSYSDSALPLIERASK